MPAAGVGFYATMALAATGRTGEARAMAARLLAQPAGAAMAPMHVAWEAYWLLPAGELDALETALAESVRAFTESDPLNRLPQSLLQQAMLLGDIGRVEEALATWGEAEALALDGRMRHLVDTVRTWRAILLAREHRTAEAEHELSGVAMAPASGWDEHGAELARARGRPARRCRRGRPRGRAGAGDRRSGLAAGSAPAGHARRPGAVRGRAARRRARAAGRDAWARRPAAPGRLRALPAQPPAGRARGLAVGRR